jgi:hypothetical protein
MFLTKSIMGAGTPFLARQDSIAEWGTVSKALEISTIVNIPPPLLFLTMVQGSAQQFDIYFTTALSGESLQPWI